MNERDNNHRNLVSEPDMAGTYTAADYLQWTMDELVELVRGKALKMSPSPTNDHQSVSLQLTLQFGNHFQDSDCKVFEAPFDVYLTDDPTNYKNASNVFQPDLFVVCDKEKVKTFGCVGAPDLVVEIISPSTARKDQKDKRELYEEYGVQEYWMVFPPTKTVLRLNLENGHYQTSGPFSEHDRPASVVFPNLTLNLQEVFKDIETSDY